MFSYWDSFYSERNGTYTRLFVAPALGVGLYLGREIGVSIWESFPIIAFGGTPYIGSTTGIRIEYYL